MSTFKTRTVMKWEGGLIEFDAVETEAPEHTANVTSYPVERGSNLTDHVRVQPVSLKLTCIVSNTPAREDIASHMDGLRPSYGVEIKRNELLINTPPSAQLPTSFVGVQLSREVTVRAAVRVWGGGSEAARIQRVQNVYAELKTAQREVRVFTVATQIGDFDSMVIRRIGFSRTAQMSSAIRFELDLVELQTAIFAQRNITHLMKPKHKRTKPKKDEGKTQTTVPDKQTEENGTLLNDSFEFLADKVAGN